MGFNTQFTPHPEKLHFVEALPVSRVTSAGTTNGPAISIGEVEGNIALEVQAALLTGTTPTLDFNVEHRVDSTDSWSAVPAAALINPTTGDPANFNQVTDTVNNGLQKLGLVKAMLKAQIRVNAVVAGTTPVSLFSATVIFSDKYGDQ
ncbi:MAG: hypothetical protein K8I30_20345 [Anaerolineae bacterium]|nr:hypothetical protein [Anaerolineae bacterium]